MSRESLSLAILFADVARSSQFYENLGDDTAQKLITGCLSRLSDVACRHQGSVVKTIGDAVMCTFSDADNAVQAAKDMQQALITVPGDVNGEQGYPDIYIGIHVGPVIREDHDIFGDAVNLAARVVSLAKPRQILITEQTFKSLTPAYQAAVRYLDKDTVKGKTGELDIYEFVWEPGDITVMLERSSAQPALQSCLRLKCGDKTVTVNPLKPRITLGRQPKNDLVLDYQRISRFHASIEYRRGKFVLSDNSANGTYVLLENQDSIFIKRDETLLSGSGIISLGRQATPGSPGAIHFDVK
ncbi:MAG: adenylate/guanylate cyclase domain-containing protein [Desulfobacterales bacterium]|jgi:class 3 adenylate cyclase